MYKAIVTIKGAGKKEIRYITSYSFEQAVKILKEDETVLTIHSVIELLPTTTA